MFGDDCSLSNLGGDGLLGTLFLRKNSESLYKDLLLFGLCIRIGFSSCGGCFICWVIVRRQLSLTTIGVRRLVLD